MTPGNARAILSSMNTTGQTAADQPATRKRHALGALATGALADARAELAAIEAPAEAPTAARPETSCGRVCSPDFAPRGSIHPTRKLPVSEPLRRSESVAKMSQLQTATILPFDSTARIGSVSVSRDTRAARPTACDGQPRDASRETCVAPTGASSPDFASVQPGAKFASRAVRHYISLQADSASVGTIASRYDGRCCHAAVAFGKASLGTLQSVRDFFPHSRLSGGCGRQARDHVPSAYLCQGDKSLTLTLTSQ